MRHFGVRRADEFLRLYGAEAMKARPEALGSPYKEVLQQREQMCQQYRFFHWDLEFPEVFIDLERATWKENAGFGAVVGNPPYVDSEEMTLSQPDVREYYTHTWRSASGNWDMFVVFVELGIELLRRGAYSSLIVPNKLLGSDYCKAIQAILRENRLVRIRDYSQVAVFQSDVYPIIYVVTRETVSPHHLIELSQMADGGSQPVPREVNKRLVPVSILDRMPSGYWWPLFSAAFDALEKALLAPNTIESLGTVVGAATVSEAYEIAGALEDPSGMEIAADRDAEVFKLLNTGTVDRYEALWGVNPTQYLKTTYQRPVIFSKALGAISSTRLAQARAKKVVIAGMCVGLEACCDILGEYLAGKSTVVILDCVLDERCLVAILNSKYCSFVYREIFGSLALQGGYLRVGPPQVRRIPVPAVGSITSVDGHAKSGSCLIAHYDSFASADLLAGVDACMDSHSTDPVWDLLGYLAQQMIDLNKRKQAEIKRFLGWLEEQLGARIDDLSGKTIIRNYLGDYQKGEGELPFEEFLHRLRNNRSKIRASLSDPAFQHRLRREYQASLEVLLPIKRGLKETDWLIDQIVYKLYGLTDEEIAIVEARA